jgi:hypothetical protein
MRGLIGQRFRSWLRNDELGMPDVSSTNADVSRTRASIVEDATSKADTCGEEYNLRARDTEILDRPESRDSQVQPSVVSRNRVLEPHPGRILREIS